MAVTPARAVASAHLTYLPPPKSLRAALRSFSAQHAQLSGMWRGSAAFDDAAVPLSVIAGTGAACSGCAAEVLSLSAEICFMFGSNSVAVYAADAEDTATTYPSACQVSRVPDSVTALYSTRNGRLPSFMRTVWARISATVNGRAWGPALKRRSRNTSPMAKRV